MAQEWLEEYFTCAASAQLCVLGLGTLRAEYIHKYNRLLDHEKQPHCDFLINLSLEVEDKLDFEEEEPFHLTEYDPNFECGEAQYVTLRFIAARHYASQGHWDNAYAYVLRSRRDNIPQHEEIYICNAQAWHYTNAQINLLVQEAEQALESRDRQMAQWPPYKPPRDLLIPPGHSTGTSSLGKGMTEVPQGPQRPPDPTPQRGQRRWEERSPSKSPLSPGIESQSEERKSVIDTVKQITGALEETPRREGAIASDTPEYDWDSRYDGIHGFPSQLRNRVSEPSTPQTGQSPKGDPKTPPELQKH